MKKKSRVRATSTSMLPHYQKCRCRVAAAIVLAGALALSACSTTPVASTRFAMGAVEAHQLAQTYGLVRDPQLNSYLSEVLQRLIYAGRRGTPSWRVTTAQVQLLKTPLPLAVNAGGGFLALSTGLLRSLGSEAELAFVIAHELAHDQLSHLAQLENSLGADDLQRFELDADRFGAGLMALAGYDPRASLSGLVHSYGALGRTLGRPLPLSALERYPELESRLSALQEYIFSSGWEPPGTVNRRDFNSVQRLLREKYGKY